MTFKIATLIVGALLFVLMPAIECVGRRIGGAWGEAQVLRVYAFGADPGFINPPVKSPLFQNSDLFAATFAFIGAVLLGGSLRYMPKENLTILSLAFGFLFLQLALAIARFYVYEIWPDILLAVLSGYLVGRWPVWSKTSGQARMALS
jgi:hypothetical protein